MRVNAMSDSDRLIDIDNRVRVIEQKLNNGLSSAVKELQYWVKNEACNLMTKEQHEREAKIRDEERRKYMQELQKNKDGQIKIYVALIGGGLAVVQTVIGLLL